MLIRFILISKRTHTFIRGGGGDNEADCRGYNYSQSTVIFGLGKPNKFISASIEFVDGHRYFVRHANNTSEAEELLGQSLESPCHYHSQVKAMDAKCLIPKNGTSYSIRSRKT